MIKLKQGNISKVFVDNKKLTKALVKDATIYTEEEKTMSDNLHIVFDEANDMYCIGELANKNYGGDGIFDTFNSDELIIIPTYNSKQVRLGHFAFQSNTVTPVNANTIDKINAIKRMDVNCHDTGFHAFTIGSSTNVSSLESFTIRGNTIVESFSVDIYTNNLNVVKILDNAVLKQSSLSLYNVVKPCRLVVGNGVSYGSSSKLYGALGQSSIEEIIFLGSREEFEANHLYVSHSHTDDKYYEFRRNISTLKKIVFNDDVEIIRS